MLRVRNPLSAIASAFNSLPVPQASDRWDATGTAWMRPASDRTAQLESYSQVSTLRQVVHSLSEDTSRVEWHMHRVRQRTSKNPSTCPLCDADNVDLLLDHPALARWESPNDFFTGQEFIEGFQQHVELTGEGYWVLDLVEAGDFGGPVEMWYARPDRMMPVKSKTEFLVGWLYRGPDGELVPLTHQQVIQLKSPDPIDIYRGSGAVSTLLTDIRASVKSALWTDNFFENSAMPGGIIEIENGLEDTQFRRLVQRWREQHKGVSNAHRVAILEHGGKWKDRSFSPKDMILTDLRQFSNDQIREAWGFPEFASGKLDNANRASSEASDAWYTQRLIVPRLDKIKMALNKRYLPLWGVTGRSVEFAYSNPVPADVESENATRLNKAQSFKLMVEAGVDGRDAMEAVGLPAMEWVRPERIMGGSGGGWGWNNRLADVADAVNASEDRKPSSTERMSPSGIASMAQKLTASVPERAALTWEEARGILNAAGAELNPSVPPPAPITPAPNPEKPPAETTGVEK